MERRNPVIQRLIDGQTVFSTIPLPNGSINDFAALATSDFDMVMIESEHHGLDSHLLRTSLQFLLNRGRIVRDRFLVSPAPFVRIPANTRERNEWIIKQTLDVGVMGLVFPHLDSVGAAQAAVNAARYPRPRGAPDVGPPGIRGWSPFMAADYWGIDFMEYYERADIWPLSPRGEILLMGIVENMDGVRALPDILKQVKGIGAIWAGAGDLSASMGLSGDFEHAEVEAELLNILRICKDHGVACATPIGRDISVEQRIDQGFDIILIPTPMSMEPLKRGLIKAGRG